MHQKIYTGIQQLYLIGLYDALPIRKVLSIFKKYLTPTLFNKLNNYVTSNPSCIKYQINWQTFKSKLDRLKIDQCSVELIELLSNITLSEDNVRTFHIKKNHLSKSHSTEPTLENTTQMVYTFLASIYQRNILASLIKYILLNPLIKKFDTSNLLQGQIGVFNLIHKRLQEVITECVLTSFNGSNYDNYLLCNSLILIQTRMKQKIHIFKKGASISSILCINKKNFCQQKEENPEKSKKKFCQQKEKNPEKPEKKFCQQKEKNPEISEKNFCQQKEKNPEKSKKCKKSFNQWTMKLYIKDVRNLVSSSMSLDKIGRLFNLPVSKLCFPYSQAKSIKTIKKLTSLKPEDDAFWKDAFSGKEILLENRKEAEKIFIEKKFTNLYDYSTYYLVQDCYLLHSIVLTLFKAHLEDSINIFIRRNYSQSNLAYQQFFIIEPSKQIEKTLAPKEINNTVYNYMIRQAVTGGLCSSFVHGKIDSNTIINEHFNYLEKPKLSTSNWPNFYRVNEWSQHAKNLSTGESQVIEWKRPFKETGEGVVTLDIRSLYPSAALKKIPVSVPLFYTRFTQEDDQKLYSSGVDYWKTLHLNKYCSHVQNSKNPKSDTFKLISKPAPFYNEYYALNNYLESFKNQKNIKILRFQSSFTALGQFKINRLPVDGFLSYLDLNTNIIYIKIIQYQSVFFHGHRESCYLKNDPINATKFNATLKVKKKITAFMQHFSNYFKDFLNPVDFQFVEIWDCDFPDHRIPKTGGDFSIPYKKTYNPDQFLEAIEQKKLTGLLVVKNLEIKKINQNPIFGFIIQKVKYGLQNLSPYTQEQMNFFNTSKRVISVHKSKSFMVISTEYFNWLGKTFGFEKEPEIYHAFLN